jgi:hypothetical protein
VGRVAGAHGEVANEAANIELGKAGTGPPPDDLIGGCLRPVSRLHLCYTSKISRKNWVLGLAAKPKHLTMVVESGCVESNKLAYLEMLGADSGALRARRRRSGSGLPMSDPSLSFKYGKLELKAVGLPAIATVLTVIILLSVLLGRLWGAW